VNDDNLKANPGPGLANMVDHLLGRPSVKSRRLQVLAVLAFWSAYLVRYVLSPSLLRSLYLSR
jgi:hypothetical protein